MQKLIKKKEQKRYYQNGDTSVPRILLLLFIRRKLFKAKTIQEQDTTERVLQHGGEATPPRVSLETKTDCVRRVRGQLLVDCIAPPSRLAQCREIFPEPSVPPVEKEKSTGTGSSHPQCCVCSMVSPALFSHPRDCGGICGAQSLRICDGEGRRGLQHPAHGSWRTDFLPVVPKQESQPVALFICTTKSRVHSEQGTQICLT